MGSINPEPLPLSCTFIKRNKKKTNKKHCCLWRILWRWILLCVLYSTPQKEVTNITHHAIQLHRAIIMQIVTHTTGIMLHSTGIISLPQRKNYKFGLTLTQSWYWLFAHNLKTCIQCLPILVSTVQYLDHLNFHLTMMGKNTCMYTKPFL